MSKREPVDAKPLDTNAVQNLTADLMIVIKTHYMSRPTSRATAQEVLNALAIATAIIICGARECGDEEGAREFFDQALENQLEEGWG